MMPRAVSSVVRVVTVLVPALFLGALVVWPLLSVFSRSLRGVDGARVLEILTRSSTRSVLTFTVTQALLSALLTLLVGLPIAHALARYDFKGRGVVRALVVVPFVLPTVVVAAALDAVFTRMALDLDRSLAAILAAHVFFNVAIVVRIVGGFWATLDRRDIEAAQVLGATPFRAFRLVALPVLLPIVLGAGLLVFLFSFTSFGVILILGGPARATLETEIHRYAIFRQEFDVAAVLAMVQLAIVVLLSVGSARFQRRFVNTGRGVARRRTVRPDTWGRRAHLTVVIALACVVIGVPIGALIESSLRTGGGYGLTHYRALLEPLPLLPVTAAEALMRSLRFGLAAAVLASIIGVIAAYGVVRGGRAGRVLEAISLVPLGVSAVTLGFGYLLAFTALDLRRSPWLIPVAHAVVGLPFVLASVVPALRAIDDRLHEAAAVLGARPSRISRLIDWPLIRRAVVTGSGFAFAISLGEFGATAFLSRSPSAFTAPLAIFRLLSQPGAALRGQALALSVVIGATVACLAAVLERLRGEEAVLL